jgi:hypothetical protein
LSCFWIIFNVLYILKEVEMIGYVSFLMHFFFPFVSCVL